MGQKSRMYAEAKTWNPFKGCEFDCTYCRLSFQRQAKRRKRNCMACYGYVPHEHPERLTKIPSAKIIFVAGNGDIAFAGPRFVRRIIEAIRKHGECCPRKTFYLQSKRPECLEPFLSELPENVILLTTLETNRDEGYRKVSKAPLPSARYEQFLNLRYPRKVVTVEPIMDFDHDIFLKWLVDLSPQYVWIGYDSHPKDVIYPEPSKTKVNELIRALREAKIAVKEKDMRE